MYFHKKRFTFVAGEQNLPLFVESIGYNPQEQKFTRPEGYPYFHWLLTLEGKGTFIFNGQSYMMTPGRGIFLKPYTPHSYYTDGSLWSTAYITFGGASVVSILKALELNFSAVYNENKDKHFYNIMKAMIDKVEVESEFSRLELSSYLYNFLIKLRTYGKINKQPSLSHNYAKVRPVVDWLEIVYAKNIGLQDIANHMNMSPQYLNRLFQDTFGISPYSFLIQLRIRKSKEILVSNQEIPLNQVAALVGFNDVSNFVATFRKKEGMTPRKYRLLHS
ncbi:AraC family transcriptional regulator [Salipaludibacillus sp. LMS25]|jgi:AraC-like DNA-binding protein|uniref:AraC family transcriptional regulator n=1 Tax=Salipaludibacillus sp. LMS25 TaxID=2924031 RepID=UPI0020D18E61|nr:AraC family transcriptional regulator [Salipaludibacillus sp. LMS25]UTR14052.1 AraC family transcriptional regulator [Salipaludibacillus sp. LMS25]